MLFKMVDDDTLRSLKKDFGEKVRDLYESIPKGIMGLTGLTMLLWGTSSLLMNHGGDYEVTQRTLFPFPDSISIPFVTVSDSPVESS